MEKRCRYAGGEIPFVRAGAPARECNLMTAPEHFEKLLEFETDCWMSTGT
jgi:hypothetical protein